MSNICRCGTYRQVREAIHRVAKLATKSSAAAAEGGADATGRAHQLIACGRPIARMNQRV
jgi:hypothetical protein